MPDNFTEITSSSWIGRIMGSIGGVFFGGILALGSIWLLTWNEGRAIHTARALDEASTNFVRSSPDAVLPANEGKLVYLSGPAQTDESLKDPDLGIDANALKLDRTAEMYQWTEKKTTRKEKNLGGSETTITNYEYAMEWSPRHVDSAQFKKPEGHANPPASLEGAKSFEAKKAHIGAFDVSPDLLSKLSADDTLGIDEKDLPKVPASIRPPAQICADGLYFGKDAQNPQLGDRRASFKVLRPGDVSLIAQQQGKGFVPYTAKSGSTVELIEKGQISAEQMLQNAKSQNKLIAWLVRGGGFFLLFIGFNLIVRPFSVLGDVIPFIGSLIGAGTAVFAFAAALLTSAVTIAIAWFAYRPLLSGGLVAGAVLVWYLMHRAHRKTV